MSDFQLSELEEKQIEEQLLKLEPPIRRRDPFKSVVVIDGLPIAPGSHYRVVLFHRLSHAKRVKIYFTNHCYCVILNIINCNSTRKNQRSKQGREANKSYTQEAGRCRSARRRWSASDHRRRWCHSRVTMLVQLRCLATEFRCNAGCHDNVSLSPLVSTR
jgi:hypothetical protein